MADNPLNNILGAVGDLAGKGLQGMRDAAGKAIEAGKDGALKAGEALRNRVHPNDPRRPGGAKNQAKNILDRPHPRFPGPLMPNARVAQENVAVGRNGGRINDAALQPELKPENLPADENPQINKQILNLHRRHEADVLHNNGMPVPEYARNAIKGRDDLRDAVTGPTAGTFNPDMVRAVEKWAQTIYKDPRTAGSKAELDTARELHGIYRSYQMHQATANSPDAAPEAKQVAADKVAQLRKSMQAYIEHITHGFIAKRGHGRINNGRFELRNDNNWAPAQAENADVDARQQEIYSDVKPEPIQPRKEAPVWKKPEFKGPRWEKDPEPAGANEMPKPAAPDVDVDGLIKKFNLSRTGKPLRYQAPEEPQPRSHQDALRAFRDHNQRQGVLGFPDTPKELPGVHRQPAQPPPRRPMPPAPGVDPRIGRNLPSDYDISRQEKAMELNNLDAQREAAAKKRAAQRKTPIVTPQPRRPGDKPVAPPVDAADPVAPAPAPAPVDKLAKFQSYIDKGLSTGRLLVTYDGNGAAYIKNMENPDSVPVLVSEIEKAMPGFKAPAARKAPPANIAPRIPDEAIKRARSGSPVRYSAEQLQAVVRQNAGGAVSAGSMAVMQRFLQDLQEHSPEKLQQMLASNKVPERSEHYKWLDSLGDATKQHLKHLAGQKADSGQRTHPKIAKLAKAVLTDPTSYRRSLRDLHHALMESGRYGPGSRPVWPDRERLMEVSGKLKSMGRAGELDAYLQGVHAGKPMIDLEETSVPHAQKKQDSQPCCKGCSDGTGCEEGVAQNHASGVPVSAGYKEQVARLAKGSAGGIGSTSVEDKRPDPQKQLPPIVPPWNAGLTPGWEGRNALARQQNSEIAHKAKPSDSGMAAGSLHDEVFNTFDDEDFESAVKDYRAKHGDGVGGLKKNRPMFVRPSQQVTHMGLDEYNRLADTIALKRHPLGGLLKDLEPDSFSSHLISSSDGGQRDSTRSRVGQQMIPRGDTRVIFEPGKDHRQRIIDSLNQGLN